MFLVMEGEPVFMNSGCIMREPSDPHLPHGGGHQCRDSSQKLLRASWRALRVMRLLISVTSLEVRFGKCSSIMRRLGLGA